jgi:hypothetical protein
MAPGRLVFGSDWPPNREHEPDQGKAHIEDIRIPGMPRGDIEAMRGGNGKDIPGLEWK